MTGEKFTLMQYSVSAILGLIDSLYNGYPTGYIITWKNPDVKNKDGGKANGKKALIDGQQRVTALMAAIAGKEVLDDDFNKDRIKIAFNVKYMYHYLLLFMLAFSNILDCRMK